ncbi:hypothetical protein [Ktedonobacter robiniae]|uniref:Uncharacterized protein n=1 Tax=Ktedonobacter robiniae TaxID=2778365 RepID=A0ABQ3V671_9CHLR|nr:hypothetical protein [Ktedonobacter robiniae]GHO60454.1 hypothetical protein KSB_89290 [Ktedonobacter robiniae]
MQGGHESGRANEQQRTDLIIEEIGTDALGKDEREVLCLVNDKQIDPGVFEGSGSRVPEFGRD